MKANWLSILKKRLYGMRKRGTGSAPVVEPEQLQQMVRGIITTRPDELTCGECFEQLDEFTENVLAGKNAAEAMPLVQDHLNRCGDCREEFEALLTALKSMT
jgi:hypothetical protein